MGLNGARIPLRSLSTDWKYCGLVDGRRACGSRVGQKYVVACALIYAGDVELSNIYTSVNTCPIERSIATTSTGYRHPICSQEKGDRKSTRLNSSHSQISYAVFCLKQKTSNLT